MWSPLQKIENPWEVKEMQILPFEFGLFSLLRSLPTTPHQPLLPSPNPPPLPLSSPEPRGAAPVASPRVGSAGSPPPQPSSHAPTSESTPTRFSGRLRHGTAEESAPITVCQRQSRDLTPERPPARFLALTLDDRAELPSLLLPRFQWAALESPRASCPRPSSQLRPGPATCVGGRLVPVTASLAPPGPLLPPRRAETAVAQT